MDRKLAKLSKINMESREMCRTESSAEVYIQTGSSVKWFPI